MPRQRLLVLCLLLAACASGPTPVSAPPKPPAPKPERLAECLARKGVHLYGASWCHWCHVQLEKFGPDAPKVPYTDCDPQATLELSSECKAQGFDLDSPFPTWVFPGMGRVVGVRDPALIAKIAGCPPPE